MLTNRISLIESDNVDATINSGWVNLRTILLEPVQHIAFRFYANKVSGTNPTLDVKIEHCFNPDSSASVDALAATLYTFAQVTTETNELKEVHIPFTTVKLFPFVKATATIAGASAEYDIQVVAYGE